MEFIVYSDCDERRNLVDFTTGPDIPKLWRKAERRRGNESRRRDRQRHAGHADGIGVVRITP